MNCAWVWVVAIVRLPRLLLLYSRAARFMFLAQLNRSLTCSRIACPAGHIAVSFLPERSNIWISSSSSSNLIWWLTPGCEVNSSSAAEETFRLLRTTASRKRSCCSFKRLAGTSRWITELKFTTNHPQDKPL